MNGDIEPAEKFTVDKVAKEVSADDYDALIMPGGTVNADRLRMDPDVRGFVQDVFRAGKPVGVICHGPWTLVEADLVRGRTLTSYPSWCPAATPATCPRSARRSWRSSPRARTGCTTRARPHNEG